MTLYNSAVKRVIFVILLIIICGRNAEAEVSIHEIANRYRVPAALMSAIQEAESGNNPYAMHLQASVANSVVIKKLLDYHSISHSMYSQSGKTHFVVRNKSYREAEYVLTYATPYCIHWDTGLFQISEYWIKRKNLVPTDLLDTAYNAQWGAKILRSCLDQEKGVLWLATECYNRGSSKGRLSEYSRRVYQCHLKQLRRSRIQLASSQ